MKHPSPLRLLSAYKHFILPAFIISCFAACHSANGSKNNQSSKALEEKIITIPGIRDTNSVNNLLHQKLPFRYTTKNKNVLEIVSNITRLHIKGDSCWLEYISDAVVHKVKDGVEKSEPREIAETTDTLLVR